FRTATSGPQSANDNGDGSAVLGLYSSPKPERAVAIPLIVFNKAAAVLYADSGTQSESSVNTAAAESLMRIAGKTIELLLSRRGAEPARPGVSQTQLTAPAAEPAFATSNKTDGRTVEPAIQLPGQSGQLGQPAVQAEGARVEPELKQESGREIHEAATRYFETKAEPRIEQIAE